MNNGTLLCRLSDMSFMPCLMPCRGVAIPDHIIVSFMPCLMPCRNMSYLPYGPNLVAYATIAATTISGQVTRLHDPAGRLAKNLSGFQKSARCGCPRLPVAMRSYRLIRFCELSDTYFVLRQFFATFSLIHETFSLFARFRPVQAAN